MVLPGESVTKGYPWRMTVAGLALIAVCYGLARFAVGLFVPAFRAEFALAETLLGTIAAGSYVGYCVAILLSGAAVARVGSRRVVAAAGTIAAVGTGLVAVASSPAVLAVGVLLAGTSTGVASPPLAAAVEQWASPAYRSRAQAVINAGTGPGIALAGLVALFALGHWRAAWACFAVVAVVVTVWTTVSVPAEEHRPQRRTPSGLAAIIADRSSLRLVVGAALFGVGSSAVWTFGRDHALRAGGLGETASTWLWVVLGLAALAGLAAGDLVLRYGLARAWSWSLALMGSATAVLGLFAGHAIAVFVAIAAFGASYLVLTAVVLFWSLRLHPRRAAAAAAVGFLMLAAGQAVASPLVGALAEYTSTTLAFLTCALVALGASRIHPGVDVR